MMELVLRDVSQETLDLLFSKVDRIIIEGTTQVSETVETPPPFEAEVVPVAEAEKPKRKRRTKAQMETDRLAEEEGKIAETVEAEAEAEKEAVLSTEVAGAADDSLASLDTGLFGD
jgi:hypothetical protein